MNRIHVLCFLLVWHKSTVFRCNFLTTIQANSNWSSSEFVYSYPNIFYRHSENELEDLFLAVTNFPSNFLVGGQFILMNCRSPILKWDICISIWNSYQNMNYIHSENLHLMFSEEKNFSHPVLMIVRDNLFS